MRPIKTIGVVVPARDEEAQLPATLSALHQARANAVAAGLQVRVVVVLDCCRDASAKVAARWPETERVISDVGTVGGARAAGFDRLVVGSVGCDWLATTDADTLVPPDWLVRQVALADAGADVVIGTAEPDDTLLPARAAQWWQRHVLTERHGHIHGANLGFRAQRYAGVGGFAPLATGEDRDLVRRLRAAGAACVSTDLTRVRTSARLVGRAPDGFAGYLQALPG